MNLFHIKASDGQAESFETLLTCKNVVIERIQSPPRMISELFNQKQDEWVCLLQGEATLKLESGTITLLAGETLFIPSGTVHQVLDTSTEPPCIWLAVHIH